MQVFKTAPPRDKVFHFCYLEIYKCLGNKPTKKWSVTENLLASLNIK
jgi:hypothetical protein